MKKEIIINRTWVTGVGVATGSGLAITIHDLTEANM